MNTLSRPTLALIALAALAISSYFLFPSSQPTSVPPFKAIDSLLLPQIATAHGSAESIKKRVIIGNFEKMQKGEFSVKHVLQLATAEFDPGAGIEMHVHEDMSETFYVMGGTGYVEVSYSTPSLGKTTTIVLLKKGMTIALNPGAAHKFVNNATGSGAKKLEMLYYAIRI